MKLLKNATVITAAGLLLPFATQTFGATAEVISPITNSFADSAAKSKLIRLPSGTLLSTYSYGNDRDFQTVYDPKKQGERPARDIYVTVSTDDGASWTTPFNLSNTAAYYSRTTSWKYDSVNDELEAAAPFYGDSGKPNIFNAGSIIGITWVDKFCPADGSGGTGTAASGDNVSQGAISYLDRDGRQLPYSCMYIAYTKSDPSVYANWTVKQLTTGERDAMQDVSRGITVKDNTGATTNVPWVVSWQEDPQGLQPGSADGPGDGVSGAIVSKGTDIWYTYVDDIRAGTAAAEFITNTQRLTQNFQQYARKDGDYDRVELSDLPIESGIEGASRANTALVQVRESGVTKYKAIVAYEETKGAGNETDFGKVVRVHEFDYNTPPTTTTTVNFSGIGDVDLPDVSDTQRIGCIISNPAKNGRRVRFITNTSIGSVGTTNTKIVYLWKEGAYDQGGPSDIMTRIGHIDSGDAASTGVRPSDLTPAVDSNCAYSLTDADRTALDTLADKVSNTAAINLSHQAESATNSSYSAASLQIDSEADTLEDARAHRGAIRGDVIFMGYTHTPDGALAKYTDLENYNFYVRRSFDGGATWTSALNLSQIDDTKVTVKEPRIVGMPSSTTACDTDAGDTWETNDDCQNPDAYIVAWGTAQNTYDQLGSGVDLDLFVTGTLDNGATYLPLALMAGNPVDLNNPEDDEEAESQLRSTPAGTALFAVYNGSQTDGSDASITDHHAWFIGGGALNLDPENIIGEIIIPGSSESVDRVNISTKSGGALSFLMLAVLALLRRQRQQTVKLKTIV